MLSLQSGNLRKAWQQLKDWGDNEKGRDQIKRAMQLCPAANLTSRDDVDELAQWAQNAFDYLVSGACCTHTLSLSVFSIVAASYQSALAAALHGNVPAHYTGDVLRLLRLERLHA